jgi:hypothetical protein
MGKRIWLPIGAQPHPHPRTKKDHLINRLWELKYVVPGVEDLEEAYIRDLVQMAEENAKKQAEIDHAEAEAGRLILESMDPAQRMGAIREFVRWRAARERAQGLRE